TAKHVTRDPDPVAADFNAQDYATLVAHPSLFRKHSYEPRLLDTTIGRIVPLLLVAPNHAESKLEASVEKLFNEGGSGNQTEQGDSIEGGQDANIQPVVEAMDTAVEDVTLMQSRRQGKRKYVDVDAGGASHPPKKLREDHGTLSGTSVGGKSWSAFQRLLAGAVLNAKVGVAVIPTLPFVTASVSTTPEREDSSHHSGPTITEAEVDSLVRSSVPIMTTATTITSMVDPALIAKEKPAKPSLFYDDSSLAGEANLNTSVFLDLTGNEFLVGGIRTVIDPNTDLQKMVDEFAPPKFFVYVHGMEHDQLFTEFNVGSARQMSLSAEVRMRVEYNVKERRRETKAAEATRLRARTSNLEDVEKSLWDEVNALKKRNTILEKEQNAMDVKATDLEASLVGKERDLTDLNAQLTFQLEKFQDDRLKVVNDKFGKLYTDFVEMALYLEEKFYPHLLTTISSRRWLLTQGMELAITKCLNSPEYLSTLGAAIGKAIEKGMKDGLSAGITHGKEGSVLTDVAAHNPSTEVDYIAALQRLQNVNFPLLRELKSSKDASIKAMMKILCLEEPFTDKLGWNELQPNVYQLMVPIHHSPDKVVIGATTLSLALDVSSIYVQKIRENIANQRLALRDVFVPLAEPFSAAALTSTEGIAVIVAVTADTTMALSITFASASIIAPISADDYEVIGTDGQAVADEHASSFPNVDNAELNIL
ncbi:hypothetical protein Tco_0479468, partial [Tanacetum coccineum]